MLCDLRIQQGPVPCQLPGLALLQQPSVADLFTTLKFSQP